MVYACAFSEWARFCLPISQAVWETLRNIREKKSCEGGVQFEETVTAVYAVYAVYGSCSWPSGGGDVGRVALPVTVASTTGVRGKGIY